MAFLASTLLSSRKPVVLGFGHCASLQQEGWEIGVSQYIYIVLEFSHFILWNVLGIFFFLFGWAHLKLLGNMGYFQQGNISNSTLGVSCAINHSAAGYYSNIHQDETLQLHNP